MTMKDLKARMIEDMKLRSLAPGTQRGYLDAVTALAAHYRRRPDQLSEQQIREYLLYLIETRKFAKVRQKHVQDSSGRHQIPVSTDPRTTVAGSAATPHQD
jgi:hypothetical protein